MAFITPPSLELGDTIGVMAPSSRADANDIEAGADILRARGYKVVIHPQSHLRLNQSAGTAEQKAQALHDLAEDDNIRAVIFAAGGNRSLQMLHLLDYTLIGKHPKIYMGFSDCAAPLNAITAKTGIITYHGPVLKRLPSNEQIDLNLAVLAGTQKDIPMTGARMLVEGTAEGVLFGGNLSLIRAMRTDDLPQVDKGILFLEDINEEYSRIDRELCALRRSGIMDNLGAIIFGQFTDLTDTGAIPFGFTFEDIVHEYTQDLGIPVMMHAPFGHEKKVNHIMPIGAKVALTEKSLTILD